LELKTIQLTKKNEEVLQKNREIEDQAKTLHELNLTKDKLFSIISHDLRGPIGLLKNTLDLIASGDLSVTELESLIPELNENIGSAFSLTDNLLYWAKSQLEGIQVKPVWFDLKDIADENCNLFKPGAGSKGIVLLNNIKTAVMLYADKDMIRLVLRNLINNALKFTYNGGKVTIGANIDNAFIDVFVQDTGTGISTEEINRIFSGENFHKNGTSGEKGSGLGLMLCRDFIEKNGGQMSVYSELGKGSKFSFRLYVNNKPA
jgi:signal transduction histidine kinase